ncbi:zinc-binding metallopeptidase family protein [Lichenibacterium ramalinae]|uniref:Zinc-ribbon domain-containing protein n=1 Tax=Lichenibacterium ramalinae TaxID=2316527 RepID=A0A4Q2RHR2_9HYPH|nr:putative zinc-binding peptidase [Lichenibacterium ramalinae]RYB05658.1 hypothetical protein D3272_08670 [Lichenibacterium ramalinae]
MKLFDCQECCQTLYFENTACEKCGHRLGYVPEDRDLYAVVRVGVTADHHWQIKGDMSRTFRFCANAEHDVCNWLVPHDQPGNFCLACRHNHTVPSLAKPGNLELWRLIEIAKHRLFYTLIELNLPLVTRAEDPKEGLVFEFLEDTVPGQHVMTGHDDGRITIALAEADDAERERRRKTMHEPYRTLLGHFRHEIGHYYWDRLVRDAPALSACRSVFGDDTEDYAEALKRHYREGAPPHWRDHFVSAYATTHAWEDFAETWAHYLHILDTLETAEAFGVATHPRGVAEAELLSTEVDFDPDKAASIAPLVKAWLPLTFALNSLNRSMGMGDLYPFVLTPGIIDKLGFIHDLIHGWVGASAPEQPKVTHAPVPENSPPPGSPYFADVN